MSVENAGISLEGRLRLLDRWVAVLPEEAPETYTPGGMIVQPDPWRVSPPQGHVVAWGERCSYKRITGPVVYRNGSAKKIVGPGGICVDLVTEQELVCEIVESEAGDQTFVPLGDWIFLEIEKAPKASAGGILLTEHEQLVIELTRDYGWIRAIGAGAKSLDPKRDLGHIGYFPYQFSSIKVAILGVEYVVLHERDIRLVTAPDDVWEIKGSTREALAQSRDRQQLLGALNDQDVALEEIAADARSQGREGHA